MPEQPESLHAALGEILLSVTASGLEVVTVHPGEYDVTPEIWSTHKFNHQLLVHDNGKGTLRMFPRSSSSAVVEVRAPGLWSEKLGGRVTYIDERQPIGVVSGGHPDRPGTLNIFEMILYHAGE